MNNYDVAEVAYKNGYEAGMKEQTNRIKDLEEALLDMVNQFSSADAEDKSQERYCKHSFMSAEENAYDVLDITYGEPINDVYERYNKKWNNE